MNVASSSHPTEMLSKEGDPIHRLHNPPPTGYTLKGCPEGNMEVFWKSAMRAHPPADSRIWVMGEGRETLSFLCTFFHGYSIFYLAFLWTEMHLLSFNSYLFKRLLLFYYCLPFINASSAPTSGLWMNYIPVVSSKCLFAVIRFDENWNKLTPNAK